MKIAKIIQQLKGIFIYILLVLLLLLSISFITTISTEERFSLRKLTNWTEKIESSTFLYLIGMENKAYQKAFPKEMTTPEFSSVLFQIATSIKPSDPRSLLGNEIPGFTIFDSDTLMAGEDSSHISETVESPPPLEEMLKDRKAVYEEDTEEKSDYDKSNHKNTTGDKEVVFIYNSHNRESFLPHLPDIDDPNKAYHKEVNITKVSDRLATNLKELGIGTQVDKTDHMTVLNEKGWGYGRSYEASRSAVMEAFATSDDIQYVIDLHRDSVSKDKTTVEIDGQTYARIMLVVGAEHSNYKKNLELANKLHQQLEEKYPGITRGDGAYTKEGARTNGVFNQDLSENSLLIEMGGLENNIEDLYRTADILAEVFSELYWDAEKVNKEKGD